MRQYQVVLRSAPETGEPQEFEFLIRADGLWQVKGDDERTLVENLFSDSDRAAAIIAGSMVENRLHNYIQMATKRDAKVDERMFHSSGPLGSFSAKIDLAFLMGLISKEAHRELCVVKDVRNLFAHNLAVHDFTSQRIKDKIQNLRLIDTYLGNFIGKAGDPLARLDKPCLKPCFYVRDFEGRKADAKSRYMYSVQLFIFAFMTMAPAKWPVI